MCNIFFQVACPKSFSVSEIRIDKIQCLIYNNFTNTFEIVLVSGLTIKNIDSSILDLYYNFLGDRVINLFDTFFVDLKRIQLITCISPITELNIHDFQIELVLVSGWTIKTPIGNTNSLYHSINEQWKTQYANF